MQAQAIGVAAELGIADLLAKAPQTLDELTQETGSDAGALARLLRLLAHLGLIETDAAGAFAVTELGKLLQSEAECSLRDYARLTTAEMVFRTAAQLSGAVQTGKSQYKEMFGTNFYDDLPRMPDLAPRFSGAMKEISFQDAAVMLNSYDFSNFAAVVDVGGGQGHLLAALLDSYRDMSGTLQDVPEVVADAKAILQAHLDSGRCTIEGGDFLHGLPEDGDLYVLKRVLSHCTLGDGQTLLENVRSVIAPHGRLLIADPDPASLYGASFDVLMLVLLGGGLRSDDELRTMLHRAGFALERSYESSPSLRLVEARPV